MNKKKFCPFGCIVIISALTLSMVGWPGFCPTGPGPALAETGAAPAKIDSTRLKPGLSVFYLYGFWRKIDQMLADKKANRKATPGKPILFINHQFGKGVVFDSGANRGVGMRMNGYIRLEHAGTYRFMAKSNDGIRVHVSSRMVINDPTVHGDRFSEPGGVAATAAGWYPIKILYYQRKGSAALELYWQTPDEAAFRIIPAEAYAHLEKN